MAERVLGAPPSAVWGIVSNPELFVALDPWHSDYSPLSHGRFSFRHTWMPMLPMRGETMTCTVLASEAPRRILYMEDDDDHLRLHEQEFLLGRAWRGGTRLQVYVRYTPPRWGRIWMAWVVQRALRAKLAAVEQACVRPAQIIERASSVR